MKMTRNSDLSLCGSVFDDYSGLTSHDVLLLGNSAIHTLLGLSAWLSEDSAWTCDLEVGVLRGEVLMDDALVNVNVSSLGGQEQYCGMLDSRLSSCDGMVYLLDERFDGEQLDVLFEQISQAKDGRVFPLALAMIGGEESSALHQKACEWAEEHYGVSVVLVKSDDNASLAQCVCNVAVCVHRAKAAIAKLLSDNSATSSPTSSRHSGSFRSSRKSSTSSSVGCIRFRRRSRSSVSRKPSLSPSSSSSISSKISRD